MKIMRLCQTNFLVGCKHGKVDQKNAPFKGLKVVANNCLIFFS